MKPQNQCNTKILGGPLNKPTKMNERREKHIDWVNIGRVNKYQLLTNLHGPISIHFLLKCWAIQRMERIEYRKVLARFFLVCSV